MLTTTNTSQLNIYAINQKMYLRNPYRWLHNQCEFSVNIAKLIMDMQVNLFV